VSLLLDTHTLLWYVAGDNQLSVTARDAIESEPESVFASIASLWELAIKIGKGNYKIDEPFTPYFRRVLKEADVALLAIDISHVAQVSALPRAHGDPFDRLIIAQAMVERLPIVSRDQLFDQYPIFRIW
jgi:PIN domain nuclease of toxin-antitoxin system